jgi:hypothetical protein
MSRKIIDRLRVAITAFSVAAVCGCSSQGLSPRETGMQTYSEVVRPAGGSIVADPAAAGPVRIDLPARISVVQMGEIAPPVSMLAAFRKRTDLFSRVSAQTGVDDFPENRSQARLPEMRTMARNLGSQYLLVFGGDLESGCQETGLSIFDLTIVGAFVVPSEGVAVSGKAAGSLIDVTTGRVVMDFSADTEGEGLAPAAFAENAKTIAEHTAKATLVKNLTADVLDQLAGQIGAKPAVAVAKE